MQKNQIILSEQDLNRLQSMLDHQPKLTPTMEQLEEELARAEVVKPEDIPANIVTMHARALVTIEGQTKEITLVYPHEFTGEPGQLNIVAPVGAAILGLEEGQTIEWPQPDGDIMQIKVEKVLYQPEREGDFL
ncbi:MULTISPECIES: nucleoside diphosphate kinase regulator [Acinetobacter]|uniref:nucleoside diphosphate kinase regulator n=1 Tax=Acinetobacter TaxID=469 RepID=UPI000536D13E|nr:nucleoside diphosphate kinase regulator [Acinetobacter sp. HR7]KGT47757.1 hypothetical protein GW12_11990 [Acinetobacter sp. HR7]